MGEAKPGPGNLAELNLGGAGTLLGGAKFCIGKPFLDGQRGAVGAGGFLYKLGGSSQFGDIVPEPSTFVLAALAGLGVRVKRYRR